MLVSDPRAAATASRDELIRAFSRVLDSGRYVLGDEVAAFEREWSEACGVRRAVGVSSGTDALALALRAAGVRPDDEVLVPAMTALATWLAVTQIGAVPVGVDVEPSTITMDAEKAEAATGPRTTALVAVHLFGRPADMPGLSRVATSAGIPVIEDAAQAHGARLGGHPVGSLGHLAAFSFYPTKNLGALGDAGAVTTDDEELADRVAMLREYGWKTRGDAQLKGVNARLDELQAALLRVKLRQLEAATAKRRELAAVYLDRLSELPDLELPAPAGQAEPVWHLFVVHHPRRDELAAALEQAAIRTAVHYRPPPHLNSAFRADGWREGAFPVAERHAQTALTLPLHPALSHLDLERVIDAVRKFCSGGSRPVAPVPRPRSPRH